MNYEVTLDKFDIKDSKTGETLFYINHERTNLKELKYIIKYLSKHLKELEESEAKR